MQANEVKFIKDYRDNTGFIIEPYTEGHIVKARWRPLVVLLDSLFNAAKLEGVKEYKKEHGLEDE